MSRGSKSTRQDHSELQICLWNSVVPWLGGFCLQLLCIPQWCLSMIFLFFIFSPLEYTAKILCYHLVNYTPTGRLNSCLQNWKGSPAQLFRNKVDNFYVADESQCPVKATFSGLGHFPTVFQSTYRNNGTAHKERKFFNSFLICRQRIFSSWNVRNFSFLWLENWKQTVSLTQRSCPPTHCSIHSCVESSPTSHQGCQSH